MKVESSVHENVLDIPMSDGFHLFCRLWSSSAEAKTVIVCIPGTGGNAEFFRPIGTDLAGLGTDVYGLDLRGFGNSVEKGLRRGDTRDFRRHLQDLVEAVQYIRNVHQGRIFMFGYSHGCAYVLWLSANHPELLDGLVLAAPPVAATSKVRHRSYLKFALLLLLAPKTMYSFGEGVVDERSNNSLVAHELSIRWLYGSKKYLLDRLFENASRVKLPTLIVQGDADTITLSEGAQRLLRGLGAEDKSVHIFPGADHFFHGALSLNHNYGEPDLKRRVSNTVRCWIESH